MRVGIVCPYDWVAPGGVKAHVKDLAEELLASGHEVSVLAPGEQDDIEEPYVVAAGKPVNVPYNGSVARINIGLVSLRRVRKWIQRGNFDVVHVHQPSSPSLAMLACWAADGPLVGTWHMSQENSRALKGLYLPLQTVLEKISGRIAVSEKARQTLVEHLGGDAVVIPNGVVCRNFAEGKPLPGYPREAPTILFLGRIDEDRKGLQYLLPAMSELIDKHPGIELLVAGPGDKTKASEGVDPKILEHVTFMGMISEADKISAFKSADVYVAPNNGGESFGIVLLEAMSAGTPVLASDIEAFQRVLLEGKAGALFANEDPHSLAVELDKLLRNEAEQERLSSAGYDRALEFDWSSVAREVERVYEAVAIPGVKVEADMSGQIFGRLG